MAKPIKKAAPDSGFAGRRAVVFCMARSIGQQIVQQLEKKNMQTALVSDEQKLLAKLNEIDPDLVLIQIDAPTNKPITQMVPDVFSWMRGRAREINKVLNTPNRYLWEKAKVILFKSDVEITATSSVSAQMADTDDIIRQCNEYGDVKYIGIYSSFSFIGKIRALIEQS